MDCHDVRSQLPAWLDDELNVDARGPLEAHLEACPNCRAAAESLQRLDADLTRAFSPQREAAARLAARVAEALQREPPLTSGATGEGLRSPVFFEATGGPKPPPVAPLANAARPRTVLSQWAILFMAAAAGFMLALLIFPPSPRQIAQHDDNSPRVAPRPEPSLARLVVSTGDVEVRPPGETDWTVASESDHFRCPSDTEVRTGAGVRCELETIDRCTIRLNEGTELTVRSRREIELRAGQVWCSSPSDVSLHVISTAMSKPAVPSEGAAWSCVCPSNATLLSQVDADGGCRIFTASGEIDVTLGKEQQRLKQGEVARIADGKLVIEAHHADALLSTSWMHSLLMRKGHTSEELGDRVNRLLASVGRSKLDNLYEDEIRSLGEHCVLPLLRYVQSPLSREDPPRRHRAMLILTDVAPTWAVGELIGLLADDESLVRVQAAIALQRLTRQTQGRAPKDWSAPLSECEATLGAWQKWWQANAHRYPPPDAKPAATSSPKA